MANPTKKPLAAALGAAFLATAIAPTASAEVNPFTANSLTSGYDLANYAHHGEEGKCGGDKKAAQEGKCGEGKCGENKAAKEGKCGGDKKAAKEGKCGEGKCGDNKAAKEGNCGANKKAGMEGKCGGNKQ
jgi:uncharacterized low-complexity protein